jgi:hypothetical protein
MVLSLTGTIPTRSRGTDPRETEMFGIIGPLLLMTWIFDYAIPFTSGFVQSLLLVLACIFLAVDFGWSQVTRE